MNEQELQRLVVRLVGDMSQYVDALKQAQQGTKSSADAIQKEGDRIEATLGSLKDAAVALGAAFGAKEFLGGALHSFEESEMAAIRLEATLKANERDVVSLAAEYDEFAQHIQSVSTQSDEAAKNLVKQAESFKLTGDAAKDAVHDSLALAAANDSSAEAMMRLVAAVKRGDIETAMMFSRMVPQLRGVRNETEFLDRYNRLVAAGWEVVTREAETAGGRLKQLENDWDNFKEQLGAVVSDGIKPVVQWLRDGALAAQEQGAGLARSVVGVTAFTAAIIAADRAGAGFVKTLAAMAVNPLTWLVAAGAALVIYANQVVEADESTRRLKEALDDLAKTRQREAGEEAKRTSEFVAAHQGNRAAIEAEIAANNKRLEQLAQEKKSAEYFLTQAATAAGRADTHGFAPLQPLEWLGIQIQKQFGGEPGRVQAEALKNVVAQIEQVRQANERLKQAAEPKTVGSIFGPVIQGMQVQLDQIKDMQKASADFFKALGDEGKALHEKLMTPQERYAAQVANLQKLLFAMRITQDDYNRGLREAAQELNKVAAAQAAVNQQTDAAAFGSSEAARRIAAMTFGVGRPNNDEWARDQARLAGAFRGGGRNTGPDFGGEGRGEGAFMGVGQGWAKGWDTLGRKLDNIHQALKNMKGIQIGQARISGGPGA